MSATSIAVVGLGTFGSTVARDLSNFDHHVIGIDIDEARVNALADELSNVMTADARDERALRDAGVDRCDAVVIAMGEDLEANIVGAMNAKLLGVRSVWVKSKSRVHRRILTKLGVDHVVNPEQDMGHRVAQTIHNPHVTDYMAIGRGLNVVSLTAPARLRGDRLSEIGFGRRYEIECLGVLRENRLLRMSEDPALETGDLMLLMGRRQQLLAFGERECG